MTTSLSKKPRGLILTSLWMTGFLFVVSAPYGTQAQQQNPAKAATFGYVTNANENTVSVIATNNNAVVATIPVGDFPAAVAITPDGTHAYVVNSFDNTVSVVDTASNAVVATIPVGQFPEGVAITPEETHRSGHDNGRHQPLAYVTDSNDRTVSVIDTTRNTVVDTIPVGGGPFGVAITPDGAHAYVTNSFDSTVSVIDTTKNTAVDTIPVGRFSTGVAITSDGARPPEVDDRRHQSSAYVTNTLDDTVSVINMPSNTVVATIPVGGDPSGVAVTPDGTHAYVANEASLTENTVSVIDTVRNKVVATITVGFGPIGVAVTPDGTHTYVTNTLDSTVSVIDTATNQVVATIVVGSFPVAVAFATVTKSLPNSEQ